VKQAASAGKAPPGAPTTAEGEVGVTFVEESDVTERAGLWSRRRSSRGRGVIDREQEQTGRDGAA
jgi:hypothetical protein